MFLYQRRSSFFLNLDNIFHEGDDTKSIITIPVAVNMILVVCFILFHFLFASVPKLIMLSSSV